MLHRRTCICILLGNDPVSGVSGMEEGDEVVGRVAVGGVSVLYSLLDGLCSKRPSGMNLQSLSLLELPGYSGRTG